MYVVIYNMQAATYKHIKEIIAIDAHKTRSIANYCSLWKASIYFDIFCCCCFFVHDFILYNFYIIFNISVQFLNGLYSSKWKRFAFAQMKTN